MKRGLLTGIAAIALVSVAGCSQREPERSEEDLRTFDVQEPPPPASPTASRAPGIVPTAAPGVAFNYRYGFRVPDANISAAQEAHAAACEKLGLVRCRITGMTYRLDDRDRVEGTLNITIDPLLARAFGRDAIGTVEKLEGRLRYAEITGEDQNPVLDEAARQQGSAGDTIAKLEADLAKAKTENERVQLREQIRQMRDQIEMAKRTAADSEAKVQRTPMSFIYAGSGASGRGFTENPAREAWYLFTDSLAAMVAIVLKALAVVLPWLVLLVAAVALFRSRLFAPVRRWWNVERRHEPEEQAQ
jgi:hypothetical protein